MIEKEFFGASQKVCFLSCFQNQCLFLHTFQAWMTEKATESAKKSVAIHEPESKFEDFQNVWSNKDAFFAFLQHFLKQSHTKNAVQRSIINFFDFDCPKIRQ